MTRLAAVVAFVLAAAADAQPTAVPTDRFELGRRLKRFEIEWESADGAARKRTVVSSRRAMTAFFSGGLDEAAKQLDAARCLLRSADSPGAASLWALSLRFRPAHRLFDTAAGAIEVNVAPCYRTDAAGAPKDAGVRLTLSDSAGRLVVPAFRTGLDSQFVTARMPIPDITEGDFVLRAEVIAADGTVLADSQQSVSAAAMVENRLAALRKAARDALSAPGPATAERQTLAALTGMLLRLAAGENPEAEFPAARLLAEAEGLAAALAAGKPFYVPDRTGQFWLRLPTGPKSAAAVRLLVPPGLKPDFPVPVVVALHGAGGSENMFFEVNGHGEAVRQTEKRGWILVSPRGGFFDQIPVAQIVDELARRYPVDRKRVFVIGHSMGATQALAAVQEKAGLAAAAAVLGGAGPVAEGAALRELPVFVGVGAEDFALGVARGLNAALTKAGARRVVYKEYADIDHILIVRAALPEVFEFFDNILAARK